MRDVCENRALLSYASLSPVTRAAKSTKFRTNVLYLSNVPSDTPMDKLPLRAFLIMNTSSSVKLHHKRQES